MHPSPTYLPVLGSTTDSDFYTSTGDPEAPVLDEFLDHLVVGYSFGPPYGGRLITQAQLAEMGMTHRSLRRTAADQLDQTLDQVEIHGLEPVFMLSFDGIESSLLLADEVWDHLAEQIVGDIVVGVPARDVLMVTGTESPSGLAKTRRAVERVHFAGDEHLLSKQLLVRRQGDWYWM